MPTHAIYVMVNLLNQIIKLETIAIEQVIIGELHIHKCNINYNNNRFVLVVFDNLRGYDSHTHY